MRLMCICVHSYCSCWKGLWVFLVRDLSYQRAGVVVGKWHMSGRCLATVCPLPARVLQKGNVSQYGHNEPMFKVRIWAAKPVPAD